MPNLGPVATLLAADLPPALSGFFGTQKTLQIGKKGQIVGQHTHRRHADGGKAKVEYSRRSREGTRGVSARAEGLQNLQADVRRHQREVPIMMHDLQTILSTKGPDDHIDCLTHGETT